MTDKKVETVAPSPTMSYSSLENGVKKSQSSPKSAFQRLRQKLSPGKFESVDVKPSTSKYSSSSDDGNGEAPEVDQWKEMEMVFRYFDENGDGKISKEELRRCVRALGDEMSDEEAEMVVQSSDADGDGVLGLEDFTKLMEGGGEEELKEAFKMYAVENSEFITPKSLKKMLNRLGNSTTIDNCISMISRFDINGDGVLSFDEFRDMMR